MGSMLDTAKDLLGSLPLTAIAQQKADLLKTHIEMMEKHIKMADERAKFAEEKVAHFETENASLKKEVEQLREIVAASALTDEYEIRGKFAFKKGDNQRRCPDCKTTLNEMGRTFECRKCGWRYEDHNVYVGSLPAWRG